MPAINHHAKPVLNSQYIIISIRPAITISKIKQNFPLNVLLSRASHKHQNNASATREKQYIEFSCFLFFRVRLAGPSKIGLIAEALGLRC